MATTRKNGRKKRLPESVSVERHKSSRILLPEKMTLKAGSKWLAKKAEEEEKEVALSYVLNCFPLDGAVAFSDAVEHMYGFACKKPTPGFFGPEPPQLISVPIGPKESRTVLWGRMEVPDIEGHIECGLHLSGSGAAFQISGVVVQRDVHLVDKLVELTKEWLAKNSIYKGQAIRLDLEWMRDFDPRGFDPVANAPSFSINTEEDRELIFSKEVYDVIDDTLFTPIRDTDLCRTNGASLNRGILLFGEYGCGKTLTATVTAKLCVENGWTFVYLKDVQDLANALRIASDYSPAVLFAEDIDRAVGSQRTTRVDEILNVLDGVDTKDAEILTVLTTNHVEELSQALLRPGRLDVVLPLGRPDADAAKRLAQLYGRKMFSDDTDFDEIGELLANHLPAEIEEAVGRARLSTIRRLSHEGTVPENGLIEGAMNHLDVRCAATAMELQHNMLMPKGLDKRTPVERAAAEMGLAIGSAINPEKVAVALIETLRQLGNSHGDLLNAADSVWESAEYKP